MEDESKSMKKRNFRQEFSEAFPEYACSKHRVAGYDSPKWVYWEIEPNAVYTYG